MSGTRSDSDVRQAHMTSIASAPGEAHHGILIAPAISQPHPDFSRSRSGIVRDEVDGAFYLPKQVGVVPVSLCIDVLQLPRRKRVPQQGTDCKLTLGVCQPGGTPVGSYCKGLVMASRACCFSYLQRKSTARVRRRPPRYRIGSTAGEEGHLCAGQRVPSYLHLPREIGRPRSRKIGHRGGCYRRGIGPGPGSVVPQWVVVGVHGAQQLVFPRR